MCHLCDAAAAIGATVDPPSDPAWPAAGPVDFVMVVTVDHRDATPHFVAGYLDALVPEYSRDTIVRVRPMRESDVSRLLPAPSPLGDDGFT